MVVKRLPVVILPSGRVPGRVLPVLPILEARRRRNRDEIAKKGFVLEGFGTRAICMQKGVTRGGGGAQAPPGASRGGAAPGGRLGHPRLPSGPALVFLEAPDTLIFPVFSPEFLGHF